MIAIFAIPFAVFVFFALSYVIEDALNKTKDRASAEENGRVVIRDATTRKLLT